MSLTLDAAVGKTQHRPIPLRECPKERQSSNPGRQPSSPKVEIMLSFDSLLESKSYRFCVGPWRGAGKMAVAEGHRILRVFV